MSRHIALLRAINITGRTVKMDRLRALLAEVDTTPDSPRGTGGPDWSDLPGRMHFIADLFRAYHEDATLFESPEE